MQREAERYNYPLWGILASTIPSAIAVVTGLVLLPRWVRTLFTVLASLLQGYAPGANQLRCLAVDWMPIVIGCTLLTLYTEVIVTDGGMKIRVYVFRWVFIPWQDVLGITVTPIPGGNDPKLWRFTRVRGLTLFHRLASICFHTGTDPVLIINRHMKGYEELIQIVEEHLQRSG